MAYRIHTIYLRFLPLVFLSNFNLPCPKPSELTAHDIPRELLPAASPTPICRWVQSPIPPVMSSSRGLKGKKHSTMLPPFVTMLTESLYNEHSSIRTRSRHDRDMRQSSLELPLGNCVLALDILCCCRVGELQGQVTHLPMMNIFLRSW